MNDTFYKAFSDRHRGSRELIKSRLEIYLPFIEPLKTIHKKPQAIDFGCGRGEWLELLHDVGFHEIGVDVDEEMLSICKKLDLNVTNSEALDYIKGVASDSQSVVSAFHMVEHIPFNDLLQLVAEAYRILKPGGLLIMETPNPENLVVGTSSFYLDPTHERPLPALLLSFVTEYSGFERFKTLYLQESHIDEKQQKISLLNVFNGVSPDYAIIAQKFASAEISALFDSPFNHTYGTTLNTMIEIYEHQTENTSTFSDLALIQQLESELGAAKANESRLMNELDVANAKIDELGYSSHHWWSLTEDLKKELQSVNGSKSWKITWPLRQVNRFTNYILHIPKRAVKSLLVWAMQITVSNPRLKIRTLRTLDKYPKLKKHMRQLAITSELIAAGPQASAKNQSNEPRARTFDELTSIRVMNAMSNAYNKKENNGNVIFLKVNHD